MFSVIGKMKQMEKKRGSQSIEMLEDQFYIYKKEVDWSAFRQVICRNPVYCKKTPASPVKPSAATALA
jgi:hypothetical protein